jgi:ubiquinone biosynthesis protein
VPNWAIIFPQFPRLIHHSLTDDRAQVLEKRMTDLLAEEKRQSRLLKLLVILLAALALLLWQLLQ